MGRRETRRVPPRAFYPVGLTPCGSSLQACLPLRRLSRGWLITNSSGVAAYTPAIYYSCPVLLRRKACSIPLIMGAFAPCTLCITLCIASCLATLRHDPPNSTQYANYTTATPMIYVRNSDPADFRLLGESPGGIPGGIPQGISWGDPPGKSPRRSPQGIPL